MRPEHVYKHVTEGCVVATKEIKQRCQDQFADKIPLTVPVAKKTRFGPQAAASKAESASLAAVSGSLRPEPIAVRNL